MSIPLGRAKRIWSRDPKFRQAYAELEPEFSLARELIAARTKASLTQAQVAKRMGTTQSVVARLEGGSSLPSLKTLLRYAEATGCTLSLSLIPAR